MSDTEVPPEAKFFYENDFRTIMRGVDYQLINSGILCPERCGYTNPRWFATYQEIFQALAVLVDE